MLDLQAKLWSLFANMYQPNPFGEALTKFQKKTQNGSLIKQFNQNNHTCNSNFKTLHVVKTYH